ncbi:MAG: hypothetical protein M0R46_03705 [Candidatus Muirbacterium halophilum]|nr:hypothetical protein [Candidatus Muirbacterium halophilum]MCK9474996.1 hypothetical protein [Candidatus Muirbacterium halophilum]
MGGNSSKIYNNVYNEESKSYIENIIPTRNDTKNAISNLIFAENAKKAPLKFTYYR